MNFAESRFWELLAAGLTVILLLRWLVGPTLGKRRDDFDKAALLSLGLFLLICVSWVTFLIFLLVAVLSFVGRCSGNGCAASQCIGIRIAIFIAAVGARQLCAFP